MDSLAILTDKLYTMPSSIAAMNDKMKELAWLKKYGHLIETEKHVVQLNLVPTTPFLNFRPGDAEPDFDALSYALRVRGPYSLPSHQETFVAALPAARKLYGGRVVGCLPKKTAASHDALLAQFFVYHLTERERRHLWIPEACLHHWSRRPDGLLLDPKGRDQGTIIEIGGHYSVEHLRTAHAAWCHMRFKIW
jgi:hypothetical protein